VAASFLNYIRSLGFGGAMGAGIAALAYVYLPHYIPERITLQDCMYIGGAFGMATHRAIDGVVVKGFLFPFGRFLTYYGKIVQLEILQKRGILDPRNVSMIKKKLSEQYFLRDHDRGKLLPP
jgi:hypothetical protein